MYMQNKSSVNEYNYYSRVQCEAPNKLKSEINRSATIDVAVNIIDTKNIYILFFHYKLLKLYLYTLIKRQIRNKLKRIKYQ